MQPHSDTLTLFRANKYLLLLIAYLAEKQQIDGVVIDNSPPVPGIVQDGVDELDIEYQSIR
jgi:hypothetical protein